MQRFERMQIWITDPKISPLDREQRERMKAEFGTNAIPLHTITDAEGNELQRFTYTPDMTPEDYLEFLRSVP